MQDLRSRNYGYEAVYTNPMIRKIMRNDERSEDCATYSSIGNKCVFFMAMIVLGVGLMFALQMIGTETIAMDDGSVIVTSPIAMIAGVFFGLIFLIMPFIAMLIKKTIPVTGTLYCISVGYVISLLAQISSEYKNAVVLAIIITIAIVAVMSQVYARGWIKVDDKFRNVVKIFFFSSIAASLLVLVSAFIPATRGIVTFISENPLLSIGASVVYIIIAALFLLVDFDAIQKAVERKMPRKYEWIAAFGLAFSVIWLFLKVLDLLMKMNNKSSASSNK